MKKAVIAPDSFKGTMSSQKVCEIIETAVKRRYPECETVKLPIADGGEGTVDCMLACAGGEKRSLRVSGPFGESVDAFYGILPDGTAVVESAAAVGLPLAEGRLDPMRASSFGVGELIRDAAARGCPKIIVGLGGTSTNDGGAGMLCALGAEFFDRNGRSFCPVGGTLSDVARMDVSALKKVIGAIELTAMCDVDNPLCGAQGASAVFGPQKGASPEQVGQLDRGLRNFASVIKDSLHTNVLDLPGGGAAGGIGAAAWAVGAKLTAGIEAVLDAASFDKRAADADIVFTGEGRLDSQSLHGKAVSGVARRAAKLGVPVIAVAGDVCGGSEKIYELGITAAASINRLAVPFEKARLTSEEDLAYTVDMLLRVYSAGERAKK
jgi:glycerate kinase